MYDSIITTVYINEPLVDGLQKELVLKIKEKKDSVAEYYDENIDSCRESMVDFIFHINKLILIHNDLIARHADLINTAYINISFNEAKISLDERNLIATIFNSVSKRNDTLDISEKEFTVCCSINAMKEVAILLSLYIYILRTKIESKNILDTIKEILLDNEDDDSLFVAWFLYLISQVNISNTYNNFKYYNGPASFGEKMALFYPQKFMEFVSKYKNYVDVDLYCLNPLIKYMILNPEIDLEEEA